MSKRRLSFVSVLVLLLLSEPIPGISISQELTVEQVTARVQMILSTPELLSSRRIEPIGPGNRSWSLTFQDATTALVDMVTGEVINFARLPTAASAQGNLSVDEAQEIAAVLIENLYPGRIQQLSLSPVRPPEITERAIIVTYTRLVNEVLYPINGARVTVNNNGSIGAFQTTWAPPATFPASTARISERAALRTSLDLLTQSPETYLIYHHLEGPEKAPSLIYLVRTGLAEVLIFADTGEPVVPGVGSATTSSSFIRDLLVPVGLTGLWFLSLVVAFLWGRRQARGLPSASKSALGSDPVQKVV